MGSWLRSGRHAARHESWLHAVAGLPWVTLVLVGALLTGWIGLAREDRYVAEAAMTAAGAQQATGLAERLGHPGLAAEVEEQVQLASARRGSVRLEVVRGEDPATVVLSASAPDPRLAAVAADTAVALVGAERTAAGEDVELAPASIPTEAATGRGLTWVWVSALGLALALWAEGAHRVWRRRQPEAVAGVPA